jgi:hypothetical protein
MLKNITLKFNCIILNWKQGFVLIISLNVGGGGREKQEEATCHVGTISTCAATQTQPRKPTGVEMAGRSVGRSVGRSQELPDRSDL